MVESMYHLRRINFHDFVTNNNNAKVDNNGVVTASKKGGGAVDELNDGDEPTKNPALYAKSTFILLDKWTKIGRNPELVDVVLNSVFHSNMISRDHSEIFIEAGKYYIQDNSLNGTYVNDYRKATNEEVVENDECTTRGSDVTQNVQGAFREEFLQSGPSTSRVSTDTQQPIYITISSDEEDTITEVARDCAHAPKKPEKQLLKEGDVIKFGHVNGAAIKAGEHAPQQSAEFIFKFEKALANHLYFGYSSKGVRVQSEKTRAYMQIHSDRLAPQEAYSANTIPKVMPQQTISAAHPPQPLNNALPLAVASVSSTTTSSNNVEALAVSAASTSTSSSSFFQIMAPKQHQRQQQAMQRPSATILPNNTSSSFPSSLQTVTPVATAPSSTVATTALSAATSQHNHQQHLNSFQHQQQQAAAAAAAQALVNHHQQQQQMAAAAAAASAAPPQPPTAATPALAAMAAATANLTPEEMAAVSAHLRQVVASSDALNSWNANLLQLSRLQQNSAALYGGNFPAAAAAAAAAYLQSGNSLWPNIPQQWRAALQPNAQSAADWMQLNQQQQQQKSAVEYMNSSLHQQLRAAAISNHPTAAAAPNHTAQQPFSQQVSNAVATQQQHHRQSGGLFLPAPMPTAAGVATTSSSLVTLPLMDSSAVSRLCGGAGVPSTSTGVSYASVFCSAASLPSALTSAYSSCTSATASNNAVGEAAKPETPSASNSFHFVTSKAYSELTTSLADGQPYLLDNSRLSDKEKAIIIAILKAKGGLSGLPSSDSSAPKSATYSNGGGANGTANSPVATHLSAANLTSMLPLMRQGMTPLSSYISNPSSLPVDQHFATALAAAINGQNNKMPTSNGGSNFMTPSSCSTASSSSAAATTLISTINAAAALRGGQSSASDLLALHQAANGAIERLSNGQQSASSVAMNGKDELAAQFQRSLQQQQHLATLGSNNSNHSSSSTSSSSTSLSTPLANASSGASSNNLLTMAAKVPLSTTSIDGELGVSGLSFKPAFLVNENGASDGASDISRNGGGCGEMGDLGLRKFDFKDVTGMTSINSLAAAMFDQHTPSKQQSTPSIQIVKKVPALYNDEKKNDGGRRNRVESLDNNDGKSPSSKMLKDEGVDESNPISLLKVNPVLIDAASKLTNGGGAENCVLNKCGGNLATNSDLRQLQLAAAAVSQLKGFGSLIQQQQHQNGSNLQQQKNSSMTEEVTTIGGGGASAFRAHHAVKTMECDSSVPSPPKFNGQDGFGEKAASNGLATSLGVSALNCANVLVAAGPSSANNNNSSTSSNNITDNTLMGNMSGGSNALHSPVISTPSRPCSYQSIPQSPPRAPRPQSIPPDSDDDESRKRCSSNDSDILSWKGRTDGSNAKQQLRRRTSRETAGDIDTTSEADENCLKSPKRRQSRAGATELNEFVAPPPVDVSKEEGVKAENNANDAVADDDLKRSKTVAEKVKKIRKSNELAHLLNDLTYENFSGDDQAEEDHPGCVFAHKNYANNDNGETSVVADRSAKSIFIPIGLYSVFGVGEERCDSFPVRGNTITDPFYLLRPSTGEDSMQSSDQEPNAYRSAFTVVMRRKTSNYYNSEKAMVLEAENSLNNENEDNAGVTTTTTTETRECGFTTKCKCVLREDVGETPLINNRVRPTDAQRPLFREKSELLFGSRERSVSAPMGSTFEMTITGSKVEEAKDMMWLSCAKCLKNENNNGNNENERNKNNLESKEKENSSGNVNCSWMYMASRNKNNAKKLADQVGEGSVGGSDGSGEKRRALRLNERKLREIQKKKSHKLMRQISDESSGDESAVGGGGEKPTTSNGGKLKNSKEKKLMTTNRSSSLGDSSDDDDSDIDGTSCNIRTDSAKVRRSRAAIHNSSKHIRHSSTTTGKLSAGVKSKSPPKRHSSSEAASPVRVTANGSALIGNKSKNANNSSSSLDKLSSHSISKKAKLTTQEKRRAAAAAAQLAKQEKEKRSKSKAKSVSSSLNSSYKRKSITNGYHDSSPSRSSKKARPKPKSSDDEDEDEPVNHRQRKSASSKSSKKATVKKVIQDDSDASSSSSSSSDAEEDRRSSRGRGRVRGNVPAERGQEGSGSTMKQRTSFNGSMSSTKSTSSMVVKQQRTGGGDESCRPCGSGKQKSAPSALSLSSSMRFNHGSVSTVERKKPMNSAGKEHHSSAATASQQDNWNYHDPDRDLCAARALCVKPQHYNINWVQCDRCDGWYHTVCAFGSNTAVDEAAEFKCTSCVKSSGASGGGSGKRK